MNTHEWPLVVFTVLSQSAIGAFIWCFLALRVFANDTNALERTRLNRLMLIIWVLMLVALGLSTFHLGSPFRAINSLFRVGHAPLSNEIFFTGAFFVLGALCWITSYKWPDKQALINLFGWLAVIAGIALIFMMAAVYRIPTVPMWNSACTQLAFISTALIAGSALAAWLLAMAGYHLHSVLRYGPLLVAVIGLILAVVTILVQLADLQQLTQAPLRDLSALIHSSLCAWSIRVVMLVVALLLWGWSLRQDQRSAGLMALVALLCIIAEMVGRLVFYSLNMTVGMI